MQNNKSLEALALKARALTLLQIYWARSGHPGGSLSCIDFLLTLFDAQCVNHATSENKFILSKGHAAPALYAVASIYGLIDYEDLKTFRKINGLLQGHPSVTNTPWVVASTGSLGQGFSFAAGMALARKKKGVPGNVYVLLGDGELQEGMVWETAMFSSHNKLNNLVAVIDYNKMQSDDLNSNIINLEPLASRWESFGWDVRSINGHSFDDWWHFFTHSECESEKPIIVIADTIKGKGIDYMEGVPLWHGSATMSMEEITSALLQLHFTQAEVDKLICGDLRGLA